MALAKSLYSIPTWTRTVALVREHDALRATITEDETPSVYACYRFATKLRSYGDLLDACIADVIAGLHERHPDMGQDLAIDGSDLPAYASGQRYVSKNGPERERFSDPDATWGHRSAVSTRKGGGYYGYKVHAAVCAVTGLPLAWTVETASAAEANFALPLIDAARDRGFDVRTAIMDRAGPAARRPDDPRQAVLRSCQGASRTTRSVGESPNILRPMRRSLLQRIHNPGNWRCGCDPTCWCKRSRVGYAFRWYVPGRFHRIGSKRRRFASRFARPS